MHTSARVRCPHAHNEAWPFSSHWPSFSPWRRLPEASTGSQAGVGKKREERRWRESREERRVGQTLPAAGNSPDPNLEHFTPQKMWRGIGQPKKGLSPVTGANFQNFKAQSAMWGGHGPGEGTIQSKVLENSSIYLNVAFKSKFEVL